MPMDVEVCPDEDARRIREYIRAHPGIRKDEYASEEDALLGSCYVASEAYFHARGGRDAGLMAHCLSWSDVDGDYEGTHWWVSDGETIYDLSLPDESHGETIPWGLSRRRAFLTGYSPSKRCQRLLDDLGIDYDE